MSMRSKALFFGALVTFAVGLCTAWNPLEIRRAHARERVAARALEKREVYVSPAELATLTHNRKVAVSIFDLRAESAFNQFHLLDAERITTADMNRLRLLPDKTVKMLIARDETQAADAYRALAVLGVKQVYLLAGGVDAWLGQFGQPHHDGSPTVLAGAYGSRHPASSPDIEHMPALQFKAQVKLGAAGGKKAAGGCGG